MKTRKHCSARQICRAHFAQSVFRSSGCRVAPFDQVLSRSDGNSWAKSESSDAHPAADKCDWWDWGAQCSPL